MDEGHETSGGNCLFSSIPTNLRSIGGIHFFYHNQCLTLKKKDKYHIRQSRLLWIRYFPLNETPFVAVKTTQNRRN